MLQDQTYDFRAKPYDFHAKTAVFYVPGVILVSTSAIFGMASVFLVPDLGMLNAVKHLFTYLLNSENFFL